MNNLKLEGIKACSFDAYGTLFNVHAAAEKCRADLGDNADAFSTTWRAKQLEYTWLRSLMRDYQDFWLITQDALDYTLSKFRIDNPDLRGKLLGLYWELAAYPEVPDMLRELKSIGKKTAILSNGSPDMLKAAIRSANIAEHLDQIHSVAEIGVFKPDPRVYQLSVDKFYLDPKEICFVSSNAWDVCGAAHFGFQVLWINRFNQPEERLSGRPKGVLSSLESLPSLVHD
ncbi:MAG: haloacid dehalogenase type II [Alphaproteobacteria bacterium]|nr:haloacid dehalogenase type II [Alphaproteobacteria bacterium]